jgi:uncharacterized membrane protein YecN with MAPEG domain
MADATEFTGPLIVTLAYLGLYYGFQMNILRVKQALSKAYADRGEKFDRYFGQDREMLAADRLQLNTLEHMPPFLILLWLNAVFVSASSATIAGAAYVVARTYYPFVLGKRLGRGVRPSIMLSTGVGYVVITYYCGALIWALTSGA